MLLASTIICSMCTATNVYKRMCAMNECCFVLSFDGGGSVCGCMWLYTHTHTHSLHVGYSELNTGVRTRHLEGPKNPDGLNLGMHVFVYVYKIHMCMYILGGGMHV